MIIKDIKLSHIKDALNVEKKLPDGKIGIKKLNIFINIEILANNIFLKLKKLNSLKK